MITLLDPGQPLPAPTLTRDGALTVSALTTWLRMTADQSAHRAGADWQRAAAHYRAQLRAELFAHVDWKLIAAARAAQQTRIAAEAGLETARTAVEENARPSREQSYSEERSQRTRHDAVVTAETAMIAARRAESAALGALRKAAMPVFCEQHDRIAFFYQEAQRAARALVDDSKRALRVVEQIDIETLLLAEGAAQ